MTVLDTPSEGALRTLAGIVSEHRDDLPAEGLPPSLLCDLAGQIRCDSVSFSGTDSAREVHWFAQEFPAEAGWENAEIQAFWEPNFWEHYWASDPCSYPDRSGDLRSVTKISDFWSARQLHATGVYSDYLRPDIEHDLMLCLPAGSARTAGPGQTLRLTFCRGRGPDFSERDRALLILLRPHLHQAYLAAEQRRHPVPRLTPRQNELLRLLAAGRTNSQIARQLGISEGTVRTHLETIYEKLGVSSRTAAVTTAFPDRMAQDTPFAARPADHVTLITTARSTGRRYLIHGAQKET